MANQQREATLLQKQVELDNLRKQINGGNPDLPKVVSIIMDGGVYHARLAIDGITRTVSVGDSIDKHTLVREITGASVYVVKTPVTRKSKEVLLEFVAPDTTGTNGMSGGQNLQPFNQRPMMR